MFLTRHKLFDDYAPISIFDKANEDLLSGFFPNSTVGAEWTPKVDIFNTSDNYLVLAELPGQKKEDIKITFADNVLTISGENKIDFEENKENYRLIERSYGSFSRSFRLSDDVKEESITATYRDGILEVKITKAEEKKPKKIEISPN